MADLGNNSSWSSLARVDVQIAVAVGWDQRMADLGNNSSWSSLAGIDVHLAAMVGCFFLYTHLRRHKTS